MSMALCNLNSDGSQAPPQQPQQSQAAAAAGAATSAAGAGAGAGHTQESILDASNATTPLLLGHEQGSSSTAGERAPERERGGDVVDGTATSIPMPLEMVGAVEQHQQQQLSLPTPLPMLNGSHIMMALPGGNLNFVTGTTAQAAVTQQQQQQQRMISNGAVAPSTNDSNNNNNPNNNVDNTSDDSNPVTIYRCRAPIASLDCMEEFSGTGGHLDFGRSISLGSNPALPLRHGSTPTPGLRYKNLGKSGLRISNVGLGTWPVFSPGVSDEQAEAILKLAIESGINLFDISEAHSETEIGKILQRAGWKRTAYVITTKVYWSTKSEERGLSRKHIIECVRASLQRLQLQYIDIVIIHKADPMCPMEEVVRAMSYVIQQGWAMYWGTARWSQVEIMEAYTNCRQFNCITPIVEQSEYHMFCREKCELYLPEMYNKIGVGLMAWGPLSMALSDTQNGDKIFLPKGSFKTKSFSWTEDEINRNAALSPQGSWGKDRIEEGRRHCDRLRDLAALAEKLGCSPTQLSIAWSLKHEPVQCLLLGATSAEQLHQSLQSLQLLPRLSSSVMLELERILENKPVRPPMISTLALR
ncbi:voltage-gated potassium channel subunit beta-2 isoform X1 [Drosophila persimilis]|uniref:voltage-gated potassium channel subunit beta-2 isoform X1 n=1 Tax=Drosophila persimilis TaxID=7234 RepID=UPI000F08D398|nr:voltage-gated potassium channel subunit beta-2 isoform X1 [Drosophila persimilis]